MSRTPAGTLCFCLFLYFSSFFISSGPKQIITQPSSSSDRTSAVVWAAMRHGSTGGDDCDGAWGDGKLNGDRHGYAAGGGSFWFNNSASDGGGLGGHSLEVYDVRREASRDTGGWLVVEFYGVVWLWWAL